MQKRIIGILMMLVAFLAFNKGYAQDEEITDEQLRRYAMLQEVIDVMKKEISVELNDMIKSQEGMTGQRYKELAATKGDEGKMTEIGAKDYEKQFFQLTEDMKNERIDAIKAVNQELATKMLGDRGKVYKRISDALDTDEAIKGRYEAILAQIQGAKSAS